MTSSAYLPASTRLYAMEGRDARDFLHRLTTLDVRNLEDGSFKPGFFLNPQGRIRAAFRLAQLRTDSFLLEVDAGRELRWTTEMLAVIDQFTFSEQYRLEDLSQQRGLKNAWFFDLPDAEVGDDGRARISGASFFLHAAPSELGRPWASVWAPAAEIDALLASSSASILSEDEFEHRRILALHPRADRELLPDANPLELGMRSAIDDNKGCYPGQEVIEKIISLGSPAKRLALIEGTAGLAVGAKLYLDSEKKSEVGTLSSAAADIGLALLRKNALEVGKRLVLEDGSEARVGKIARYE